MGEIYGCPILFDPDYGCPILFCALSAKLLIDANAMQIIGSS